MLFSFDKLLTKCVHDGLTNRLAENKLRYFFLSLMKIWAKHSAHTWKQIKQEDRHFHIFSEKEKLLLEKHLKPYYPSRQLTNYLNNLDICQISLDEKEGRAFGILQQINNSQKHPERNHLFSPLFLDFEHSFHPNLKKKLIRKSKLICIMESENC